MIVKKKSFLMLVIIFSLCAPIHLFGYELHTIYGSTLIKEPVLQELLECLAMQRLKDIHQYGISFYVSNFKPYSRYEHSIGVFYLVRLCGGSLKEQIAALLHDASHTVFSHVGDYVFKQSSNQDSYQDNIHLWYLAQTEIAAILARFNLSLKDIDHKSGRFRMLEQPLPNICADRLEYIMYGGFIEDKLSLDDIHEIMRTISFENGAWIFEDRAAAKKLALTSLYLTEYTFGSAQNHVFYDWAAKALLRAVDIELITLDDIHFSTDPIVWKRLIESNDPVIMQLIHYLTHSLQHYKVVSEKDHYDIIAHLKFRGIDPFIKTENGIKRLTEIDKEYAKAFERTKTIMEKGWCIQYKLTI